MHQDDIVVADEDVFGGLDCNSIIAALMDKFECELRQTVRTAMVFRMSQCGHVKVAGLQNAGESFTIAGTGRDNRTSALFGRHVQGGRTRPFGTEIAVNVIRTVNANGTINAGEAIGTRTVNTIGAMIGVKATGTGGAIGTRPRS
jgi:hypothetical protein